MGFIVHGPDFLIKSINQSIVEEIDLLEQIYLYAFLVLYPAVKGLRNTTCIVASQHSGHNNCAQLISLQIKHSHTVSHCDETIMPQYVWVGMDGDRICQKSTFYHFFRRVRMLSETGSATCFSLGEASSIAIGIALPTLDWALSTL